MAKITVLGNTKEYESGTTFEAIANEYLEADSLDAVEIILGVEEEYGVEIPDEDADNFVTVGDIVKYIDSHK